MDTDPNQPQSSSYGQQPPPLSQRPPSQDGLPQQPPLYESAPQWGQQPLPPYRQPPHGQPQYGYWPPQPPKKPSSRWPWIILALLAGLLVLGCIGSAIFVTSFALLPCPPPPPHSWSDFKPISFSVGAHPTSVIDNFKPISFSVGAHPRIMIDNGFNTTDVHVGSAKTVILHLTGQNVGSGNLPEIDYDQSKDSNTITVMVNVSLDVTVPSTADVQVQTNTGDIDVTGVSGQMGLETNGGAIKATQDSLSQQSKLHTTSGSITFNGSLDPKGTYLFQSTDGSVAVTLPSSSSFHVDAWTHGSISSTFPEVTIQHLTCSVASASGDVGSPPRARVILQTTASSISLNKQ